MIQPGQLVVLKVKHTAGSIPVEINPRSETRAALPAKLVFLQWFGPKAPAYALLCKDHQGCIFTMRPRRR